MMKQQYLTSALVLLIAIVFSNTLTDQNYLNTNSITKLNNQPSNNKGRFIDIRDNKSYRWVKIGSQVWMAENFAYDNKPNGCWAYNNDKIFSGVFGYLYNWQTAMALAPKGWHLPSDQEWEQMIGYLKENGYSYNGVNGDNAIAKALTKPLLWVESDIIGSAGSKDHFEIINRSGFSALAGGRRENTGEFFSAGVYGYWWTATEGDEIGAYCRSIYYKGRTIERGDFYVNDKTSGYSVRYVKD
jgi:uncharacterized protein (TIGR02145 family)